MWIGHSGDGNQFQDWCIRDVREQVGQGMEDKLRTAASISGIADSLGELRT